MPLLTKKAYLRRRERRKNMTYIKGIEPKPTIIPWQEMRNAEQLAKSIDWDEVHNSFIDLYEETIGAHTSFSEKDYLSQYYEFAKYFRLFLISTALKDRSTILATWEKRPDWWKFSGFESIQPDHFKGFGAFLEGMNTDQKEDIESMVASIFGIPVRLYKRKNIIREWTEADDIALMKYERRTFS